MRILVAEQEEAARRVLTEMLGRMGHVPEEAVSQEETVRRLEEEDFELVFAGSTTCDVAHLPRPSTGGPAAVPLVVVVGAPERRGSPSATPERTFGRIPRSVGPDRLRRLLHRAESALASAPDSRSRSAGATAGLPPSTPALTHARSASPHALGFARLGRGTPHRRRNEPEGQKTLTIDATSAPPELLGRLLVGSYITGQDRVLVSAGGGLTLRQRAAVHQTADRILGMTVVGDSDGTVEVQNFVDPGRYELPKLLHRVVRILHFELDLCHRALADDRAASFESLEPMEEEVDRLYLLMARQILLSSDSPRLAHRVDLDSHHYQLGYRLVAKVLEVTGDLVFGIGQQLVRNLPALRRQPPSVRKELARRLESLDRALLRTADAFARRSAEEANALLNQLAKDLRHACASDTSLAARILGRRLAVSAQCIASNLEMAMEMLVIVNETTLNRCVEPENAAETMFAPRSADPPNASTGTGPSPLRVVPDALPSRRARTGLAEA
jgi:hypothetical protein